MKKRTVLDLKELFKQASEIAQQVPQNMQEAAFNRAIDLLTGGTQPETNIGRTNLKNERKGKIPEQKQTEKDKPPVNVLLSSIDSTQYPGIASARKVLDRSLMVLQIALTDHDIDGLVPRDIAKILTEKFRVSTTTDAVGKALGRAITLVNRVSIGQGYLYRIMKPGKDYLAGLSKAKVQPPSLSQKKKTKKKTPSESVNTEKKNATKKEKAVKTGSKKAATKGKIGPKAAIISLIESGFFSKGRSGPEVQAYLNKNRGFSFGTDQLRLAMLRLVRDERLDRGENSEGKYEYKKSDS